VVEMAEGKKVKLALYWAATCGGCDVATLDIEERILDLAAIADIVLWPVAMDFKYEDVETLEDGSVDICLFNGAVRLGEHEELAKLLRQKCKVMVAFGSCACFGGIPGLANVANREQIFNIAYKETVSTENPEGVTPQTELEVDGKKLTLPVFFDEVFALDRVVDVDYYVPGCPPAVERINDLVDIVAKYAETGELPPKGAVIASEKALCEECPRKREEKRIKEIRRPQDFLPDTEKCLLEQGLICLGPATRGGCGARCINANMPCRGCYGPTAAVRDHGASVLSAIASVLGLEEETELTEEQLTAITDQIKDPLGTFYRFTLPVALLNKVVQKKEVE